MKIKTLKEVAKILKISVKKASKIKQIIENEIGAPKYMVWGTGDKKGYSLESFEKKLAKEQTIIKASQLMDELNFIKKFNGPEHFTKYDGTQIR